MLKNKITGLPAFILPLEILDEMHEYMQAKISAFPREAITETVSEWAERKRILGAGLTARPGPVDFNVTPFLREIVDCLSDNSPILEVYVIKGTQLGFSVMVLENHIGYCIQYGIGPLLYIGGDQAVAEEVMEKRVDEMIYSAGLQEKVRANIRKAKGKSTGDRADSKSYSGTFMRAVGPNSESKLRTFPMRILHEDEIDVYPQHITKGTDTTADPLEKAERRADSYDNLKKIVGGSTPKDDATSRITKKVEEGDKRFYNVKCPKCGLQQPLLWANFKWDKTEDGRPDIRIELVNDVEVITKDPTYFICAGEGCDFRFLFRNKYDFLLEKGRGGTAEWIPTKIPDRPFVRSYVIPAWYGFRSWIEIVLQFYRVKDDPFLFPTFVNDVMAETWKESAYKPDDNELYLLSQEFEHWPRGFIKKEILYLTLAVDVQKDRLECGLMGAGRSRQFYLIEYWVFDGSEEKEKYYCKPEEIENRCWKRVEEKIQAKYIREDGMELFVQIAFIDTSYLSGTVDLFCEKFPYNPNIIAGIFPAQGRETQDRLVKKVASNIATPVVGFHDQEIKRVLYSILRKRPQGFDFPSYYIHFSSEYSPELYKQLTAEEIVRITIKGVEKGFKILNTKQRRNEVLDITKMCLLAFQWGLNLFFEKENERRRIQKRNEIQEDVDLFFDFIEQSLYS